MRCISRKSELGFYSVVELEVTEFGTLTPWQIQCHLLTINHIKCIKVINTSFYAPCPFCTSIVELLFVVGGGNIYNLYTHGLGSEGGVNEGKPNGEETPALTQQMNRNLCFQSEDIDKVESRE